MGRRTRGRTHARLTLQGEAIDRALAAMGDFADLVSPYLVGHSAGVAELAAAAAQRCGFPLATWSRRGGPRSSTTWGASPSPSSSGRRPGRCRRTSGNRSGCTRTTPSACCADRHFSPLLCRSATVPPRAARRHRLPPRGDGGRPHATGAAARRRRRVPRHDRAASAPRGADAGAGGGPARPGGRAGRLDADSVAAVLGGRRASGTACHPAGGVDRARGRGVGLLARGLQTKQIARVLGISAKTADRHIQNAYAKIGVSTRPLPPCSRCSTVSSHGENSRWFEPAAVRSVAVESTRQIDRMPSNGGGHEC